MTRPTTDTKILVLLPSLALLRQPLHEWLRETRLPNLDYLWLLMPLRKIAPVEEQPPLPIWRNPQPLLASHSIILASLVDSILIGILRCVLYGQIRTVSPGPQNGRRHTGRHGAGS